MRPICKRRDIIPEGSKITEDVTNKWKWAWLEHKTDKNPELFRHFLKKLQAPGKAYCCYCQTEIEYGDGGVSHIKSHVDSKSHSNIAQNFQKPRQTSLSSYLSTPNQKPEDATVQTGPSASQGRAYSMEGMILSWASLHNISWTTIASLVDLIKMCSVDKPALDKVDLSPASAASKLVYGMAPFFSSELSDVLKTVKYSLNLDEATNKNNKDKLFSVLVNYFSQDAGRIIQHVDTVRVLNTKADTLVTALEKVVQKNSLDWENLLAIMSDNCPSMRGNKTGLEKQIKEKHQPDLMPLGGDTCHMVANAAKEFTKPFQEKLLEVKGKIPKSRMSEEEAGKSEKKGKTSGQAVNNSEKKKVGKNSGQFSLFKIPIKPTNQSNTKADEKDGGKGGKLKLGVTSGVNSDKSDKNKSNSKVKLVKITDDKLKSNSPKRSGSTSQKQKSAEETEKQIESTNDDDESSKTTKSGKPATQEYLITLFNKLYTDFKFDSNAVEALLEICQLLGVPRTTPGRFVDSRWLNLYDKALETQILLDALTVFYWSYLSEEERCLERFSEYKESIFRRKKNTEDIKNRISAIQKELKERQKKSQAKGVKLRREKIVNRLYYRRNKTLLHLDLLSSYLAPLKQYVIEFQAKQVGIHKY